MLRFGKIRSVYTDEDNDVFPAGASRANVTQRDVEADTRT
jgi:hypothetical protein